MGGQGLNLGIGDAITLGWRLSAVVAGTADPAALDDFSRERKAAASQVIDNVADQREHMRSDDIGDRLRMDLHRKLADRDMNSALGLRISGQLHPPASPLTHARRGQFAMNSVVGTDIGNITLVDLLAGSTGLLVLHHRGCSAAGTLARARIGVRCVHVDERTTPVVVRPDGVVVWTSTEDTPGGMLQAVEQALGYAASAVLPQV